MTIRGISRKISDNYGWSLAGLYPLRTWRDGVTFFQFEISWDRFLADHKPSFLVKWEMCNFLIAEFEVYYLHHRDGWSARMGEHQPT